MSHTWSCFSFVDSVMLGFICVCDNSWFLSVCAGDYSNGNAVEGQSTQIKDSSYYYDQRSQQPCHLSSSIYYGGQDIYHQPQNSQDSSNSTVRVSFFLFFYYLLPLKQFSTIGCCKYRNFSFSNAAEIPLCLTWWFVLCLLQYKKDGTDDDGTACRGNWWQGKNL